MGNDAIPPTESACNLHPLHEALREGKKPPEDHLGIIACSQCLGVFDVVSEPGGQTVPHSIVNVSCRLGYSLDPTAHLDG